MSAARRTAEEILFPELAAMMDHNRANLQFGSQAESQIERIIPLVEFAEWVVSLDDDDPESPGRKERQTITLNKIIQKARDSL